MTVEAGQIIDDGNVKWRVRDIRNSGGVPIGTITPRLQSVPEPGEIALDTGPLLSRAAYPDFWEYVQAKAPLVSEAEWQAMAAVQSSVGYYSAGDGSTTFRAPRLVDYQRGGLAADVGTWQEDMFKSHIHVYSAHGFGSHNKVTGGPSDIRDGYTNANTGATGGEETRPKTIRFLYCVKAFDSVTDPGLLNSTVLANEVANKQATLGYIKVFDQKTSGTSGGTFTSGAWRTRDLNQLKTYGNISGVSLSGNQLTIPAGTYSVQASAPACNVDSHKTRLRNITAGTTLSVGSTAQTSTSGASDYVQTDSVIHDVFTIAESTTLELQHISQSTFASNGFGFVTSLSSGEAEIYTQLELVKIG